MAKHDKDFKRPKKGDKGTSPKKSTGSYKAAPAKKKPPADKVGNVVQAGETIQQRKAYTKYRTDTIPTGSPVLSFEEWKRSNGIEPAIGK